MSFLPPMTGNGKDITYRNGDLGYGLLLFYPHDIFCLIHFDPYFAFRIKKPAVSFPRITFEERCNQSPVAGVYVLNCCYMFYVALVFCGAMWTCSPVTTFFLKHDSPVRPKWMPTQPSPKLWPNPSGTFSIQDERNMHMMFSITCAQRPQFTFPKPTWRYQPATSLIQQIQQHVTPTIVLVYVSLTTPTTDRGVVAFACDYTLEGIPNSGIFLNMCWIRLICKWFLWFLEIGPGHKRAASLLPLSVDIPWFCYDWRPLSPVNGRFQLDDGLVSWGFVLRRWMCANALLNL